MTSNYKSTLPVNKFSENTVLSIISKLKMPTHYLTLCRISLYNRKISR